MNFHWELRKSSCRRPLKILTEWTLHVLEVRRHELGRMLISGPAGQHIGWANNLADAFDQLALADTKQVLPENGPLNTERSSKT